MKSTVCSLDVAIIGGGPVGAALALGLQESGLSLTLLEARGASSGDLRAIALSHGSRVLLERLGAWHSDKATPIREVHVSQRGGFGRALLKANDLNVPNLGYVIDYKELFGTLSTAIHNIGTPLLEGARVTQIEHAGERQHIHYQHQGVSKTLSARLVVLADGGDIAGVTPPKATDYGQHALTARVTTTQTHNSVAYERFTPQGPLALLPMNEAMALVWTLPPARAESLLAADDAEFLRELRAAFGGRLGEFTSVAHRACYPLALKVHAPAQAGVIPIGNAAQTLHPVAGQGFNLGLRDACELARLIRATPAHALSGADFAHRYHAMHRVDRSATIGVTHGLVKLFSNDMPLLGAARGAGIALLGALTPAKQFVARRMMLGTRG